MAHGSDGGGGAAHAGRGLERLRIGTSSWSEPGWVGSFYPPGTKPAEMLALYAREFTTVEADTTYYRVPSATLVRGWRAKTPPGFTLSAKFPRSIVHAGEGPHPDGAKVLVPEHVGPECERYLDVMRELGDRAGPLVLQFPYFNRTAFAGPAPFLSRLEAFLRALPRDFRYAVEVRNKAWIGPELLALLAAHGVALVLVDIRYMPHPADLARELDLVSADFVYARLIGDRQATESLTQRFDALVLDQGPRLDRWAELLGGLLPRVRETFAYANNHYAGHGPATARDLARRVAARLAEPDARPAGG
ncbi:MAG: DUF72 domain-containing protein [Planctomycetes bacterium]|nr:DUF72 domain-containing protein [Planctomycetota bacterium]